MAMFRIQLYGLISRDVLLKETLRDYLVPITLYFEDLPGKFRSKAFLGHIWIEIKVVRSSTKSLYKMSQFLSSTRCFGKSRKVEYRKKLL